MNEPIGRRACFAVEMNAALGRYNEFIDVRDEEVFARWHHTAGLRCLACRHPVTVYLSRAKNPFVRHLNGHAAERNSQEVKSARETFLHYRLKYWVRDELAALGSDDADVEVAVGQRRPDVFGHLDGCGYAVEIQWSPLDYTAAATRTRELRVAGADSILWLTRSCNWVEQLPALGIETFDPAGDDYQAHTGFLTWRPRAGLRVTEISVRDVLRQWVSDEIAWAYRDHKKAGWATVTDWQRHTKAQADTIAEQRRQLDAARAHTENQARELTAANTRVSDLEAERDGLLDDKTSLLKRVRALRDDADDMQDGHARDLEVVDRRAGDLAATLDNQYVVNRAAVGKIEALRAEVVALSRTVTVWRTGATAVAALCAVLLVVLVIT